MKILIDESVLRQALDALYLRRNQGVSETYNQMAEEAITALRTALDAAEKVEPVCWCVAYDDPAFGRIHSNPSMCEPELDAHIAKCDGRLVKVPLYAAPTPPTKCSELDGKCSELREAARAVVDGVPDGVSASIDRLRKALT